MASFDSFINTVIPYVIGILAFWLFIHTLRTPLGALWRGIKGIFSRFKDKDEDSVSTGPGYIQYE